MKTALLVAMAAFNGAYVLVWSLGARGAAGKKPTLIETCIGFVTNFFDTLGIGSFATTSVLFKLFGIVRDEHIPGTLNVGHTLPSALQAFIFIAVVEVDALTLALMIGAAIIGAWLGARVVARWPRRKIQIGMGSALLGAAGIMLLAQLSLLPAGGERLGLEGLKLVLAVSANVVLGALMTLGIGLYAPCMMVVSLLGMNPRAAFPIMMGSCAFLMPIASIPFIRRGSYNFGAALGLMLGGLPGVLLAAFLVKSLPLEAIRWLVIIVVVYTALMMLRSASRERHASPAGVN